MLDRPQIGDIVLVWSCSVFRSYYEAEITAVDGYMDPDLRVFCRYQVRPIEGWLRYRRWIRAYAVEGIVSRAADRQREQEIEKLEKML